MGLKFATEADIVALEREFEDAEYMRRQAFHVQVVRLEIPGLRVVSEANQREHWATKASRKKTQRYRVKKAWRSYLRDGDHYYRVLMTPPYEIICRRYGKKAMDDDNLAGGFKAIRDEIAACLGIDDGDKRIKFKYEQIHPAEYGVVVIINGGEQ